MRHPWVFSFQARPTQIVTKAIYFKDFTLQTNGRKYYLHRELRVKPQNFCYLRPSGIVPSEFHILNR